MSCVFIAAGGTGGHIYPGLALADALVKSRSDLKVYFVGTPNGLENKLIPAAGFPLVHLSIGRLNRNVGKKERIMTLVRMPFAFLKAIVLMIKYRPKCVIGIGGHASGPMLLMAAFLRTPTMIWEPNAMPGLANRWLAPFVSVASVVFDEAKQHLKAKKFLSTGMPLRKEIEQLYNMSPPPPQRMKLRLFVFGGSQGAMAINNLLVEWVGTSSALKEFEIIHQTGPADFDRIQSGYEKLKVLNKGLIKILPYIDDMPTIYKWADIIIARAGTGTLAEIAAVGKPSVLIPLPTAADNHQQKNAEVFVREKAAVMILQKDLTPQILGETLRRLKNSPDQCVQMGQSAKKFFTPHAAQTIANEVLKLGSLT